MKTFIVSNPGMSAVITHDAERAIKVAEKWCTLYRTIVWDWRPHNHSQVVWDTGRERVRSHAH